MIRIIKRRKIWYVLSGVLVVLSIASIIAFGLNLGIDFKGGSLLELSFSSARPENVDVENKLSELGLEDYKVQSAGDNNTLLRMESINEDKHQEIFGAIKDSYETEENKIEEVRFESIGPTIGAELKTKAVYAIILVLIAIIIYIAYVFRKVSTKIPSWKFGLCAIVALFHDIIIVVGIFALLGRVMDVQLDSLFVIALLTVLGYSVNDSIVVFDRIRFNILKSSDKSLENLTEISLNQTLTRSLNTSVTTLLVLLVLFLFGGATIQWFVLALIIGVVAGTYSSIFVASPILVSWENWRK